MKTRWMVASLSALLSLVLIELISSTMTGANPLRLAFTVITPDQDLLWKNGKNINSIFYQHQVRTNHLGLRVMDDSISSPIDLLALGASPTFGWGVATKDSYPYQLSALPASPLKVINAGMIGHSTFQALKLLPNLLNTYRPKVVTIPFVINDVERLRFAFDGPLPDDLTPLPSVFSVELLKLLSRSNFYWLLQAKKSDQLASTPLTQSERSSFLNRGPRVALNQYLEHIRSMVQLIVASGATPVLLIFPVNLPVEADCQQASTLQQIRRCLAARSAEDSKLYNQKLIEFAQEHSLDWIDLRSELLANPEKNFLIKQGDHIHPSADGHQIIARLLYQYLGHRGLL